MIYLIHMYYIILINIKLTKFINVLGVIPLTYLYPLIVHIEIYILHNNNKIFKL